MSNHRTSEAGFSLVETLVALVVLSLTASSLLTYTQNYARQIDGVMERTAARWSAEYVLLWNELGFDEVLEETAFLGRPMRVSVLQTTTKDKQLRRLDVAVFRMNDRANVAPLYALTGYMEVLEH